jgi:hypothetical protein
MVTTVAGRAEKVTVEHRRRLPGAVIVERWELHHLLRGDGTGPQQRRRPGDEREDNRFHCSISLPSAFSSCASLAAVPPFSRRQLGRRVWTQHDPTGL